MRSQTKETTRIRDRLPWTQKAGLAFLAALSFSLAVYAGNSFVYSDIKATDVAVEIDAAGRVTAMRFLDDLART